MGTIIKSNLFFTDTHMLFNKLPLTKSPRSKEELSTLKVTFDTSIFTNAVAFLKSEAQKKFADLSTKAGFSVPMATYLIKFTLKVLVSVILLLLVLYIVKTYSLGTIRPVRVLVDLEFDFLKFRFREALYKFTHHTIVQYLWAYVDLTTSKYSQHLSSYLSQNSFSIKTPFPSKDFFRQNSSLFNNFLYQTGVVTDVLFSNWSALIIIGSVSIVYYFYQIFVTTLHSIFRMLGLLRKAGNWVIQKFLLIINQLSEFPVKAKLYLIDLFGYENRRTFHYLYTSDQLKAHEQVVLEKNISYPKDSESLKQILSKIYQKKLEGHGLTVKEDIACLYSEYKEIARDKIVFIYNALSVVLGPLQKILSLVFKNTKFGKLFLSLTLPKKNVFPHLSIYNAEPMAVSSITFRVSGIVLGIIIMMLLFIKSYDIKVIEDLVYYTYNTTYIDSAHTHPKFNVLQVLNEQSGWKAMEHTIFGYIPLPDTSKEWSTLHQFLMVCMIHFPIAYWTTYLTGSVTSFFEITETAIVEYVPLKDMPALTPQLPFMKKFIAVVSHWSYSSPWQGMKNMVREAWNSWAPFPFASPSPTTVQNINTVGFTKTFSDVTKSFEKEVYRIVSSMSPIHESETARGPVLDRVLPDFMTLIKERYLLRMAAERDLQDIFRVGQTPQTNTLDDFYAIDRTDRRPQYARHNLPVQMHYIPDLGHYDPLRNDPNNRPLMFRAFHSRFASSIDFFPVRMQRAMFDDLVAHLPVEAIGPRSELRVDIARARAALEEIVHTRSNETTFPLTTDQTISSRVTGGGLRIISQSNQSHEDMNAIIRIERDLLDVVLSDEAYEELAGNMRFAEPHDEGAADEHMIQMSPHSRDIDTTRVNPNTITTWRTPEDFARFFGTRASQIFISQLNPDDQEWFIYTSMRYEIVFKWMKKYINMCYNMYISAPGTPQQRLNAIDNYNARFQLATLHATAGGILPIQQHLDILRAHGCMRVPHPLHYIDPIQILLYVHVPYIRGRADMHYEHIAMWKSQQAVELGVSEPKVDTFDELVEVTVSRISQIFKNLIDGLEGKHVRPDPTDVPDNYSTKWKPVQTHKILLQKPDEDYIDGLTTKEEYLKTLMNHPVELPIIGAIKFYQAVDFCYSFVNLWHDWARYSGDVLVVATALQEVCVSALLASLIDLSGVVEKAGDYFFPRPVSSPTTSIYRAPEVVSIRLTENLSLSSHIESLYQVSGLNSGFVLALTSVLSSFAKFFNVIGEFFTSLNKDLLVFVTSLDSYKDSLSFAKIVEVLISFIGLDAVILHTHVIESIFFNDALISWHLISTFFVLVVCSLLLVHYIHAISHFLLDAGVAMEYVRRTGYLFFLYEFIIVVICISPVFVGGFSGVDHSFKLENQSIAKYLYDFVPASERFVWYNHTSTDIAKLLSFQTDHPFHADRPHVKYIQKEFVWESNRRDYPYNKNLFTWVRRPVSIPVPNDTAGYVRDPYTISIEGYNPSYRKYSRLAKYAHYYNKLKVVLLSWGIDINPQVVHTNNRHITPEKTISWARLDFETIYLNVKNYFVTHSITVDVDCLAKPVKDLRKALYILKDYYMIDFLKTAFTIKQYKLNESYQVFAQKPLITINWEKFSETGLYGIFYDIMKVGTLLYFMDLDYSSWAQLFSEISALSTRDYINYIISIYKLYGDATFLTVDFTNYHKPEVEGMVLEHKYDYLYPQIPMPTGTVNTKPTWVDYPYAVSDIPARRPVYPYLPFNTWPNPNIDYETPINYIIAKCYTFEMYVPVLLLAGWLSITFYSQLFFGYFGRGVLFEDPLGDEDSWMEHPHI